jgi:proline-specific peptidase
MYEATETTREGYLPLRDGWIWYRALGIHHEAPPLLVLHGGPAAGSAYLESLAVLAEHRSVIFYDQLGCGRSEEPFDPTLWRIERFVEELAEIRQLLNLQNFYLFGHSWGGWLAIEYLLTQPGGVLGAILASTSASLREYCQGLAELRRALPPDLMLAMERGEALSDYESPVYKAALLEFYNRHLCRLQPWPPVIMENVRHLASNSAYRTLQGPNELVITGNLKDWDRTERLGELKLPVLVTVGRYDEATPACAATLQRLLPDARLAVFENSAHMPHLEEQDAYIKQIEAFLQHLDTNKAM